MSTPLGIRIELDKNGIDDKVARVVAELSAKHKIQLGFGLSQTEITNMKTQIEVLQKQFAQTFARGIEPLKGVGKELGGLKDKVNVLNGVQVKLVGNDQTQMIQKIKTSLIETQKIVTDFKTRNVTTTLDYNYEKGKKTLYGELIKLQKNEFELKGQIIGKEGLIKEELEKQLKTTKNLQTETNKLIKSYQLTNSDDHTKVLRERKALTSDLVIKQEQYNQSVNKANNREALANLKQINTLEKESAKSGQAVKTFNQETIKGLESRNKELAKTLTLEQQANLEAQKAKNSSKVVAKGEDLQQISIYDKIEASVKRVYGLKREINEAEQKGNAELEKYLKNKLRAEQSDLKGLNKTKTDSNLVGAQKELEINKLITEQKILAKKAGMKQDFKTSEEENAKAYSQVEKNLKTIGSLQKENLKVKEAERAVNERSIKDLEQKNALLFKSLSLEQQNNLMSLKNKNDSKVNAKVDDSSQVKIYNDIQASLEKVYNWKAKVKKAEDDGNVALQKYYDTQLKVEQTNLKGLYNKKDSSDLTNKERELEIDKQIRQAVIDINTAKMKQEKATNVANYSEVLANLKQINNLEKENAKTGDATKVVNQGIIEKLQERNKALYTTLDLEQKIGVQTLRSDSSKKNTASELDRIKALGTVQSAVVPTNLFTSSSKDIDRFINGLMVGKEKFKEFTREARGTDSEVIKFTTTTKISGKESLVQAYSIDKITGAMYKLEGATKNTEAKTATFVERLKHAFNNITSFVTVSAFFYQVVNSIRAGITSVIELDSAMNALRIDMMGAKESAFDALTEGSMKLSLQLGTNIKDITDIMSVYANANSTAQDVLEKTAPSAILSNISGMTGLNASDAIQSVLLVFDEFKNSSDSVATQSAKVSDTFASVASKLNLNFKTGLTSMASAVKVSGAVINEAGMDLNTYSSIVGNLAEKTRLSGETIGTSMKTIVSRISRAKTGDASADEISNADKAFKTLGINVRKGNGEFEDLDVTLTALSKKWKGLTAQQRSYIAEESAGVRQKAVFINMMDDYATSTKLATEALTEQGIASAKNDIYLESTKAKIQQFKTTIASVWTNMISSKFLNGFVTSATKLVETFFSLEKIIGLATLSLMIFKGKAIESAIIGMTKFGAVTLATEGGILKAVKATALWNTVMGLNPVTKVAMAIIAVLGLMAVATNLSEASSKKAKEANDELMTSYSKNVKGNADTIKYLQEEGKEYDALKEKTTLTSDEKKKFYEIQERIKGQFPELITGYDEEGNAILDQTLNMQELVNILKKKNELENNNLLSGGDNALKVTTKELKDAQKEIDKYKEKMDVIKSGGKNVGQGDYAYKNTIDGITKELEKQNLSLERRNELQSKLDKMADEYEGLQNSLSLEYDKQSQSLSNMQPFISAIYNNKNLDDFQQKMANSSIDWKKFISADGVDFSGIKSTVSDFINQINSDKGSFDRLKVLTEIVEPTQEQIGETFTLIGEMSKKYNVEPIELAKMFDFKMDKADLSSAVSTYIKQLEGELAKSAVGGEKGIKSKINLAEGYLLSIKVDDKEVAGATEKIIELTDAQKELEKTYDGSIDVMGLYAKALKEVDTNGHLSSATTKEIAKNHRELAPYLDNTKVLYQKIQEEMAKEKDVAKNTYDNILMMDANFFKTISTNKDLLNKLKAEGYTKDFENAKNLAEAKVKLESETIKIIAGAWADYFDAQGKIKWGEFATDIGIINEDDPTPSLSKGRINDMKKINGMQDAIAKKNQENADRLNAFKPKIDFAGLASDLEDNTKVGKDSSSKEKDEKTSTSEALKNNPFDALLNKQNKSLEDQDLLIGSIKSNIESLTAIGSDNARQKALEQQNKLYDEQVDKIAILKKNIAETSGNEGIKKAENFLKSNWSGLKSKDITKMSSDDLMKEGEKFYPQRTFTGDNADKESKKYNDGKQLFTDWVANLDKLRSANEKNGQDLVQAQAELTPMLSEKWQLQFDAWENIWSRRIDASGDIQDKIDLLESNEPTNAKEKIKLTNELIKQEELVRQGYVDANVGLSKQLLVLKEDTQEWQTINKQIEIYNENIDGSDKTLASLKKSLKDIEKENLDMIKSSQEKIKEAITKRYEEEQKKAKETVEANKKLREKEHKDIIDKLDDEKKAYDDFYKAKLKDLDRESGDNQYTNKVNDLIKEKMTLQKEYDSLLMDDSLGAKARREDIKEELAKVQRSIEGEQFDRNIELQKNNINDLADAQNKTIEDKIEKEKDAYELKEKEFEKELDQIDKKYEKLLSEENLYRESTKAMIDNQYVTEEGHIMTLTTLITDFTDKWADGLSAVGDKIKTEILDNLAKAQASMGVDTTITDTNRSKVKDMKNGSVYIDGEVVDLNTINSKEGMEKYKDIIASAKTVYIKGYDGEIFNNKTGEKASFSEGGVIDYTGEANVHGSPNNAEVVFNSRQALGLYKFVTKLPSDSLNSNAVHLSKTPRLPQNVTTNSSEVKLSIANLVNIEGNVDKNTLPDVEDLSKKVLTKVQKELNKHGIFKKV